MAPPKHRRLGYSRKAQMGLFAGYVIAVVGAVAGGLMLVMSAIDPTGFQSLRQAGAEMFAPVARGGKDVSGSVGSVEENIGAYIRAGKQNRDLRRQLDATRLRLLEAEAIANENRQLKKMLKLRNDSPQTIVVSRLIASSASSARRLATLDAGRNEGVKPGQPVRAPEGLIGRILDVGPTLSRVLLLADTENVVPIRRARDALPALAVGRADGNLDIRALNTGISGFKRGDVFVTSGSGGLYQPNIPVAVVIAEQSDGAIGRPIAHPARVTAVLVERAYRDLAVLRRVPAAINVGDEP